MIIRCHNCGKYHESLTICPELRLTFEPHKEAVSLPPTAEQTSIARFNALANQIRELVGQLARFEDKLSHDKDYRLATTAHILSFEERMKIQFDAMRNHLDCMADQIREMDKTIGLRFEAFVGLLIDKNGFDKLDGLANRLDALTKGLVFLHSQSAKESRAVAKKKAAPLVGKKGTGRKG